jgi:hypothetical protein
MQLSKQPQNKLQTIMGYTPLEKISPPPSNSADPPRLMSRRKHATSGVLLITTSHKEFSNRPDIDGFPGVKPKRKTYAKIKAVAQKKQKSSDAEETCCFVCEETSFDDVWIQCEGCKNWSHEDCQIN